MERQTSQGSTRHQHLEVPNQGSRREDSNNDDINREFLRQNALISQKLRQCDKLLMTCPMILYRLWILMYTLFKIMYFIVLLRSIFKFNSKTDILQVYLTVFAGLLMLFVCIFGILGWIFVWNALLDKKLGEIKKAILMFKVEICFLIGFYLVMTADDFYQAPFLALEVIAFLTIISPAIYVKKVLIKRRPYSKVSSYLNPLKTSAFPLVGGWSFLAATEGKEYLALK